MNWPDPIGPEMSRAVEEISFGIDIPEALKNLSTRIECVDLKFFITALIVQRETGGNLAELIESISRLIRLRFELFGRIKALSAEGKMSALVLIVLPFLLLFGADVDQSCIHGSLVFRPDRTVHVGWGSHLDGGWRVYYEADDRD